MWARAVAYSSRPLLTLVVGMLFMWGRAVAHSSRLLLTSPPPPSHSPSPSLSMTLLLPTFLLLRLLLFLLRSNILIIPHYTVLYFTMLHYTSLEGRLGKQKENEKETKHSANRVIHCTSPHKQHPGD